MAAILFQDARPIAAHPLRKALPKFCQRAVLCRIYRPAERLSCHQDNLGSDPQNHIRMRADEYAILGQLRARGNYRQISEEMWPMTNGAPSTPMGEAEAAWVAARARRAAGSD